MSLISFQNHQPSKFPFVSAADEKRKFCCPGERGVHFRRQEGCSLPGERGVRLAANPPLAARGVLAAGGERGGRCRSLHFRGGDGQCHGALAAGSEYSSRCRQPSGSSNMEEKLLLN